jgi:hypothetical protein
VNRGVTIARSMAVIAIVALDCGLIRIFLSSEPGPIGQLLLGLAFSLGLIGIVLTRGRWRRFSLTFSSMLFLLYAYFVSGFFSFPEALGRVYLRYAQFVAGAEGYVITRFDLSRCNFGSTNPPGESLSLRRLVLRLYRELSWSLPYQLYSARN